MEVNKSNFLICFIDLSPKRFMKRRHETIQSILSKKSALKLRLLGRKYYEVTIRTRSSEKVLTGGFVSGNWRRGDTHVAKLR